MLYTIGNPRTVSRAAATAAAAATATATVSATATVASTAAVYIVPRPTRLDPAKPKLHLLRSFDDENMCWVRLASCARHPGVI